MESSASRHNVTMEQHLQDDVDLALWVAANRPIRPNGWASIEGEEPQEPVFRWDSQNALRIDGHPDMGGQQQKAQAPGRHGWGASAQSYEEGLLAQPAAVWADARPELIQCRGVVDPKPDAWAGSLDVLPDVPGGLESVDQLATHVSLWPTTTTDSPPTFRAHSSPNSPFWHQ